MGFNVSWKVKNRVILCELTGSLTRQDIEQGNNEVRQHVIAGEKPIHTVMDLRHLDKFPVDFNLFRAGYPLHDSGGWLVLVGGTAMIKYVTNIVAQMTSSSLKRFDTLEKAYQFLNEQDATLPSNEF